jgi:glycosyltransferase involved in cell wall biosynthesis
MKRSTILSDARWSGPHGIGRFAREVLSRLPEHAQLTGGPRPLSAADPLWLSCQVVARRPAVFFSPGFNPPPLCPARLVFTIHDLIHLEMPGAAGEAKRLYYALVVKHACRRAHRVLTVSEYSRARIVAWSGLPGERVVNVGNGVGAPFDPDGPRRQPGFPYILYVGNARSHKNLDRLLPAFRELDRRDLRLLLAGAHTPALADEAARLGIGDRTVFLGTPADDELAALYRGATLLAMPSLMEGFGLPALEAMACGTPVVAACSTALPEVVGEAGVYVDPSDWRDIARGMARLLDDRDLRCRMRCLGLERARHFSWDAVAARVRAVLEEAAHSCRPS